MTEGPKETEMDLSPRMIDGLTNRYGVKTVTARALERRGLIMVGERWELLANYQVTLTPAGVKARDALIAPFTPGTRVRNTITGLTGVIRCVDSTEHHDVAVLRWDDWENDTCGSIGFLEVIENEETEVDTNETTLREVARAESINEPGATFEEHLDFLIEVALDLEITGDPDAVISDADATRVLQVAALEADGSDDVDQPDDPDAAYDRWLDTQLGV